MIDFAYASLGLRFNPFGELERQQKIDQAIPRCDLEQIANFVADASTTENRAVQFMGEPGTGKSTHLLMLADRLEGFRYTHIPMDTTRRIPEASRLMIDEAQRLTWKQKRHLFRNANRILLGTHVCMKRKLESNGFQVLTIELDRKPEIPWLIKALGQKVAAAQRPGVVGCESFQIGPACVHELITKHGSNIRAMERELYEVVFQMNARTVQGGTW